MTKDRMIAKEQTALPLFALIGAALGLLAFLLITPEGFGNIAPPIVNLKTASPLRVILSSLSQELLPLLAAALVSFAVKHPLPLMLACMRRAFLFSLSSAYLAAYGGLTPHYFVYTLIGAALLLATVAAGIAAATHKGKPFAFLYFIGVITLLTVIRLLAFTLIL